MNIILECGRILLNLLGMGVLLYAVLSIIFPLEIKEHQARWIKKSEIDRGWQLRYLFTGFAWMQATFGVALLICLLMYSVVNKQTDRELTVMCVYWGFAFIVMSFFTLNMAKPSRT